MNRDHSPRSDFFQRLIWQWMWGLEEQTCTLSKMRAACGGLWEQYFSGYEPKNAHYYFFYPLLRKGLIEFVGQGKYRLTPSFLGSGAGRGVLINGSAAQIEAATAAFGTVQPVALGTHVIEGTREACREYALREGLSYQHYTATHFLAALPSLQEVVAALEPAGERILAVSQWYRPEGGKPIKQPQEPGIYRPAEQVAGRRYFYAGGHHWYVLPGREHHPDIYNLCASYELVLKRKNPGWHYDRSAQVLHIEGIYFPIVAERLLRLQVYLAGGQVERAGATHLISPVSEETYDQLRRIFGW